MIHSNVADQRFNHIQQSYTVPESVDCLFARQRCTAITPTEVKIRLAASMIMQPFARSANYKNLGRFRCMSSTSGVLGMKTYDSGQHQRLQGLPRMIQ